MFEGIINFFKRFSKNEEEMAKSKDTAKERLHLVLMQDRANVSADFLDLMKQEIIDVIKKYIDVDESAIDVRLTNKENNKEDKNQIDEKKETIKIEDVDTIKDDTVVKEKEESKEEIKSKNK